MIGNMLDACDYVTRTNAELVRLGVPAETATYERLRRTGHMRRLSPTWGASIGSWSVKTLRQIAEHVGVPVARAHTWAQFRRLKTRTRRYRRTQAELAVLALATAGPAKDVAPILGLLPVEVVLYRAAGECLRVETGTPLLDILQWSPARLEAAWRDLNLVVEHVPPRTTVDYSNPEEIAAIADEAARRMSEPSDLEKTFALIRKELPGVDLPDTSLHEVEDHDEQHLVGTLRPEVARDLDQIIAEAEQRLEEDPASIAGGTEFDEVDDANGETGAC